MKKKARIRIKLYEGRWYAFGSGVKWERNPLLVPAINFCKRLNDKLDRKGKAK